MDQKDFNKVKDVWVNSSDLDHQDAISHIRGKGIYKDLAKWESLGKRNLPQIKQGFSFLDRKMGPMIIAEWGVGGGSNINALIPYIKKYIGIDISLRSLEASQAVAEENNITFTPILIEENPQFVLESIHDPVDLFLSTAVFQHFPSKEYAMEVLQIIAQALKVNGVGVIQIRYDNGEEAYKPIENIDEYKVKHMRATSFMLDEFWKALLSVSLQPLYISNIREKIHYATFVFTKNGEKSYE